MIVNREGRRTIHQTDPNDGGGGGKTGREPGLFQPVHAKPTSKCDPLPALWVERSARLEEFCDDPASLSVSLEPRFRGMTSTHVTTLNCVSLSVLILSFFEISVKPRLSSGLADGNLGVSNGLEL